MHESAGASPRPHRLPQCPPPRPYNLENAAPAMAPFSSHVFWGALHHRHPSTPARALSPPPPPGSAPPWPRSSCRGGCWRTSSTGSWGGPFASRVTWWCWQACPHLPGVGLSISLRTVSTEEKTNYPPEISSNSILKSLLFANSKGLCYDLCAYVCGLLSRSVIVRVLRVIHPRWSHRQRTVLVDP
jgi:hypothetical protein